MVLGWGKKTVTKHDDEEDMTMDEILASIRRYVTEDQNAPREIPETRRSIFKEQPELLSARSPVAEQSTAKGDDYNSPYVPPEMVREQQEIPRTPAFERAETTFTSEPHSVPHPEIKEPHPQPQYHAETESGVSSESTISAAAMALSKLAEVKGEQQMLGALTLDTLISNLARPMIKEWLDQHLAQIVEAMVEREIERIRNYSSK
ncbi:DUF2497 domain-containing protein [Candidatus Paracaedibacter symbiosus]|uniref:DUF2497 domain-containing protein n=1 Tax=Candidatus Paracaedibacter symbiosus TaxID=244582 RepID=UPI0005096763|nr:DUF2497 domain-containing protein [Candidatus Paracaedibacter symbiosus]